MVGCGPLTFLPADLVIINGKEPESLDPVIINGQADGRIVSALFEGLVRYNTITGRPEPGLASTWEISTDRRTYRFHLRPNLQWSNGQPISAQDLLYSWQRVLTPASACEYANILFPVQNAESFHNGTIDDFELVGIKAITPNTIQINLSEPTSYFLDVCCYPALAIVPRTPIETHGDRWLLQKNIPTNGAYQLVSWKLNDCIRLRKNPFYWDHKNVQSETVDILPTSNASTALNLYEMGEVDIVWDKELVPTELVSILRQRSDFHVTDFLGTYFLRFNTLLAPFNDPQVRRALALSIDKHRLIDKITGAGESVAPHFVPPGIPGYDSPSGLDYDPEEARQLLADAGYPNGESFPPIDYLFNSSKLNEQIAVEIQAMWQEHLGVKTVLRQLEWKSYLQDQSNINYGVSRSSWLGDYVDPQTFLDVFTSNNGNNRTGWENTNYDGLISAANSEVNNAKRMEQLREAESILVEEFLPIIPLYFYVSMEYYDPKKVSGIFANIRAEHPIRSIKRIQPRDRDH